jgi:hypothetical protein
MTSTIWRFAVSFLPQAAQCSIEPLVLLSLQTIGMVATFIVVASVFVVVLPAGPVAGGLVVCQQLATLPLASMS